MKTNAQLIKHLVGSGVITHQRIMDAFSSIDRGDFVTEDIDQSLIYEDHPLLIGYGQTISQPSTVAFMIELLNPQEGEKILDVGTGSGWTSALLGHIVGENGRVHGIEIIPELVIFGKKNIDKYNFRNVSIAQATGRQRGDHVHAPYDRILVSAAARGIPLDLVSQLKVGGIMVVPVENDIIVVRKKTQDDFDVKKYYGFVFVPLI
jgi:protein-L-isoaspartate(D-aspartate) O-methyltransferase